VSALVDVMCIAITVALLADTLRVIKREREHRARVRAEIARLRAELERLEVPR
jgi:hypothetical protein